MTKIILVRHGETDWCRQKRVRGSVDIPLNDGGKKEAQMIADKLSKLKINAIYSGKSSCSASTALEIARERKVKVKALDEFGEVGLGLWQGLLVTEVEKRFKKHYSAWKTTPIATEPPGGESAKDAYDRTISALHKLVDRHKDGNICVVSGSITLSIIKSHIKKINLEKMWKGIPDKTWWEVLEV